MASPLSTSPISGTRDFFPEEMSVRQQVFARLYEVVESFGYLRYDGPMLEPMELYASKSSEEIVAQQTYRMTDRGGRDLVVRPEMTPTVARMIAAKAGALALPARWYSHPNLWRYERKQRGRYREHWQVNVDLFGTESSEAEAEILAVGAEMMFALGASTGDFQLRVSDRALVTAVLTAGGVPPEQIGAVFGVLDQLDKVPTDDTTRRLAELGLPTAAVDHVMARMLGTGEELLAHADGELTRRSAAATVMKEGLVTSRPTQLVFDHRIIRGFTYYTSTVFEIYDTNPANPRSIAGGGRYDNLVAVFGKQRIPGIGFGMGDVTLIDFLETHGLAPRPRTAADVAIVAPSLAEAAERRRVRELASELRRAGLRVVVPLEARKMGKQLETASKDGVRFAVIAGGAEAERGAVVLRDLAGSAQSEVPRAELAARIRAILDGPPPAGRA